MQNNSVEDEAVDDQFILFELAGEPYGIDIEMVHEVVPLKGVSRVPQAPDYIAGVINLRGYAIPVIDLAKRFNIGAVNPARASRIIILETEEQILGIAVDKVFEIVTIEEESIEPPSALIRGAIRSEFLIGFAEVDEALVKILDLEEVFSQEEISEIGVVDDKGAEQAGEDNRG